MAKIRKFSENANVSQVLDPAVVTADALSSSIDMLNYEEVTFLVSVGESGDSLSGSVKIELELQDSDDDSTYAAAADADVLDSVTGTNTGTFAVIDAAAEDDVVAIGQYSGGARYVKCNVNVTGTHTNGTPIGVVAVQTGGKTLPVS